MLRLTGRAIDRSSHDQGVKFVRGLRAACYCKLSAAPTKLIAFRRINSPQASARPMNFRRVAVNDVGMLAHIIGEHSAAR
jgi:hypothetical protein